MNNNENTDIYNFLFKNLNWYNSDLNCYNYKYVLNELRKIDTFDSLLDVGTGRGNLINFILKDYPNKKITTSDIENFHNINVPFYKIDLNDLNTFKNIEKHDIITCTDVLEHLPEENINNIIQTLSTKCKIAIFTIANHDEIINNVQLHLIQKDLYFWKKTIEQFFKIKNLEIFYDGRLYLLTCIS